MECWKTDLTFLENALPEMEAYLFSEQIFWPMTSGSRLTIGMLILAQRKLSAVSDQPSMHSRMECIDAFLEAFRSQWRTNWSNKASKEFDARLRQWDQALKELLAERDFSLTPAFRHEVTWRVLLELLKEEMVVKPSAEQLQHLTGLDRRLKAAAKPGAFIWDDELVHVFPEEQFWFLYLCGFRSKE